MFTHLKEKDEYCPYMQETPLLLSHMDTGFISPRGFMFCFPFMLLSSATFFFPAVHSHTHPLIILFPLLRILYLQALFFTENQWSLIKTEFFCKAFPISEGHHESLCLLCSGGMFLSQLMPIVWKLYGDTSVGLSEDLPIPPSYGIFRVHSTWQMVNKRVKHERYKV